MSRTPPPVCSSPTWPLVLMVLLWDLSPLLLSCECCGLEFFQNDRNRREAPGNDPQALRWGDASESQAEGL